MNCGNCLVERVDIVALVNDVCPQCGADYTRACRHCGCTEAKACVGAGGIPCHWVEWDLCSVCVAEHRGESRS